MCNVLFNTAKDTTVMRAWKVLTGACCVAVLLTCYRVLQVGLG